MSEQLQVQAGDIVAVDNGYGQYTVTKVKHVTPTGQIVVEYGIHEWRFNSDGWEKGGGFRRRKIVTLTPERQASAMRDKIKHIDWEKVSDREVMQIAEVLGFVRKNRG